MILCICPNPSIDTYAWLENFAYGGVNRITRIKEYPGGKGVHVAHAVSELGGVAGIMSVWGGRTGEWIKEGCAKNNISVYGINVPGNNRKCYTFRSEGPDLQNSELLEPGPSLSPDNWKDFKKEFKKLLPRARVVCMSGSWPKNAPDDAYQLLIKVAAQKGVRTILDCSGVQLEEALKTGFFGLHINREEAEKLCGSSRLQEVLKKLDNKVELVALTKGKDGLELFYKGNIVRANVKIDKVVSTVGSGDCLTAGIAFAVEKNFPLEDIAAYGVACGAANCITEDLGMLKKKDVERLLSLVQIKQYSDGR